MQIADQICHDSLSAETFYFCITDKYVDRYCLFMLKQYNPNGRVFLYIIQMHTSRI